MSDRRLLTRRRFISGLVFGALALRTGSAFAQELVPTPRQTEGPFYPDRLPLDTDNDLVRLKGVETSALGQVTHLRGIILDARGQPVKDAVVEIWQVDHHGVYLHRGSGNRGRRDPNFQGFGRFVTGASGEYRFRTIKPVSYPGRTPHIHVAVMVPGQEKFTTQCYVKGEPRNARDGLLNSIRDPRARASVIVPFTPLKNSQNELSARFDIVLGMTPAA